MCILCRLKVAPNMVDPIGLKNSDHFLKLRYQVNLCSRLCSKFTASGKIYVQATTEILGAVLKIFYIYCILVTFIQTSESTFYIYSEFHAKFCHAMWLSCHLETCCVHTMSTSNFVEQQALITNWWLISDITYFKDDIHVKLILFFVSIQK